MLGFFKRFSIGWILIAGLLGLIPLLHPGFFVSDDGGWMIIRLASFFSALRSGEFPVRFLLSINHGYGYPLSDFLYPGYLYLGSFIHLFHIGFINTIKGELALFFVLSGIGTYLWLRMRFSQLASVMGAFLYMFFPYHLYDMYTRGSVGELMALAVVPFILWQLERQGRVGSSMGIGLLIISHNILAALFLPVLFLYALAIQPCRSWQKSIAPFGLGMLLSMFFWLPALYDLRYTVFLHTSVADWQKYFASYSLIGSIGVVCLILPPVVGFIHKQRQMQRVDLLMYALGLLALFLSVQPSGMLWQILPVTFIQFPFRFLSVVMLSAAYLSAYCIHTVKYQIGVSIAFLLLLLISIGSYLSPQGYIEQPDAYFATNQDTTTVKNEYMPQWVQVVPTMQPQQTIDIVRGIGSTTLERLNSHQVFFSTRSQRAVVVQVNVIYFPGWQAKVDGKATQIAYNNTYGLMQLMVPAGEHEVHLSFTETPVRLFSDIVSLITLIGLLVVLRKK